MFSRIFNLQKREGKKEIPCEWHESLDDFQAAPRVPKFGKASIRVLIFRECDKKGKSLLFDSDAVVEVNEDEISPSTDGVRNLTSTPTSSPSRAHHPKYKCLKPKSDINMLGEMMFGSVTMTHRGSIVRAHYIRTPPQLLLSKVFATRSRSSGNALSEANTSASFNQPDSFSAQQRSLSSGNISIPLLCSSPSSACNPSTPSSLLFANSINYSLTSIDSLNMSREGHLPPCSPVAYPSPSSSFNRRLQRSQMTRLENYQHSKLKALNNEEQPAVYRRQPKIGIGVVFRLWETHEERNKVFQNFIFSHYALYERHLQKLRIMIERALFSKKHFIASAVEAVEQFKEEILNFYSAPRLLEPAWLHMVNIHGKQEEIAQKFISILMKSITNFLSSLLTAVLMNHLSWVPTVTPSGSSTMRAYLDKHSSKTLDILARCHPYNPLWAQLGDLYGTLGFPPKVTKTIVVGKDPTLVRQILYILSYFIRCGDIKEYSISVNLDSDFDACSSKSSDRLSCYSKTPTNTPVVHSWTETIPAKSFDKNTDYVFVNDDADTAKMRTDDDMLFDDAEEICNCMCSVLQGIDYIGGKDLGNLRKKNTKKEAVNKHADSEKNLNTKNRKTKHVDENNIHSTTDKSDRKVVNSVCASMAHLTTDFPKHSTFRCYCCDDKENSWIMCTEMSTYSHQELSLKTICTDAVENSTHSDVDTKSCVCLNGETSEYGSETVSRSTLSRQSSCTSCLGLEFYRKADMRSLDIDSDYSSFTNEDHVANGEHEPHNGIELDLHEIVHEVEFNHVTAEEIELNDDVKSLNLTEIHLPESEFKPVPQRHHDHKVELPNFGRSLLAGYCDNFVSDFALHGVKSIDMDKVEQDLKLSLKYSAVGEAVSDAAYIIADIDARKCKLVTLSRAKDSMLMLACDEVVKTEIYGSSYVSELLDSLKGLWDLNIPFEFCLMHLEDRLQDIFSKSEILAEYIKLQRRVVPRMEIEEKFRGIDLDLLIATASTHSSFVPPMIN
eukprot:gene11901-13135_t